MTVSINDTTILAVLSRYPDMPREEADEYISKIENERNVPVCEAIIKRIDREELEEDAKLTFDELDRWSRARTQQTRNEQISARTRRVNTRLALKLTQLNRSGRVSDQTLIMYGVRGELPDMNHYHNMTQEERNAHWEQKMESTFGPHWRHHFESRNEPIFLFRSKSPEKSEICWQQHGF